MSGSFQSTALAAVLGLTFFVPAAAMAQSAPGSPVAGATVPDDPETPSPLRIDQGVVSPWARVPLPEFPERALARGVGGRVIVQCGHDATGTLTACEVTEETPPGLGFGSASLAASRRARLAPDTVERIPADALLAFVINFRLPPEPPRLLVVEDPSWRRPPRPAFPRSARRAGIASAEVRLDCEIVPVSGRLRNCLVKEESRPGHGFGAAAVRATRETAIAPYILSQVTEDAHAVFTVTFTR